MDPATAGMALQAASGAVSSLVKGVGSLFGGRKRRKEERAANAQYRKQLEAYTNFDMSNQAEGLENAFEDLTVNQKQAQFVFEKNDQTSSDTLSKLNAAAGGSGVGGLVQAMMGQRNNNMVKASLDIGKQEFAANMASAKGQAQVDALKLKGAMNAQAMELGRTETLLGMAGERKAAATQARTDATNALVEGFTGAAANTAAFGMATDGFDKDRIKEIV